MISQQSASIQLNEINKVAPPELPNFPLLTTLRIISKNLHVELNQLAKKYGDVFQIRSGRRTLVVLNGLETIKEALVKQQDSFNARADFEIYQQTPQCYFMEKKSGEPWLKHRRIVGQVMHNFMVSKPDILERWALEEATDLTNMFVKSNGQPFDPTSYLPLATLSFTQRLIFNKRGSLEHPEEDSDFLATARGIGTGKLSQGARNLTRSQMIPKIWQPIFMWLRSKSLQASNKAIIEAERYILKNVEHHRKSFDPENMRDLTDGLLKASSELTESDRNNLGLSENDIIKGSLIQFVGAGTNLPSIMLRWALLYMITHPAIQAEIHKELDEVVGRKQQPTIEHRGKLPFTEACIHEVFRYSSATVLPAFVYATATDATLNGYSIPENTPLLINYYSLTRDERYWEEPEKFNPYRFLDKNGNLEKNLLDKFYPFGIGSRRCIGEHLGRLLIFTFFTNLMHKCKFEKVPGEKLSLKPRPAIILFPQDYKVIAKPRF